jgi:succinoglycan biosynthesis protein ExoM
MGAEHSLVIAVLTYRRPDDLRELLPMLVEQAGRRAGSTEVLVVDNDPDASARELVTSTPGPVRYVHEPEPGIVAGRNRALDEAAHAELLIFIDDDERPVDDWLALMEGCYLDGRPAGVVGAVISRFEVEPDPWITAGDFFRRRRLPTGTEVEVAATNNLLLDLHQVRAAGLRFDPAFGITGGSDTLFSRELVERGGRLVWCDEAVVTDMVPTSRLTRGWVLQRAYRSGNSWSRVALTVTPPGLARVRTRVVLTGRGAVRAAGGFARATAGRMLRSPAQHARGLRTQRRGSGMVAGAWGGVYAEYRRDQDGSR